MNVPSTHSLDRLDLEGAVQVSEVCAVCRGSMDFAYGEPDTEIQLSGAGRHPAHSGCLADEIHAHTDYEVTE